MQHTLEAGHTPVLWIDQAAVDAPAERCLVASGTLLRYSSHTGRHGSAN